MHVLYGIFIKAFQSSCFLPSIQSHNGPSLRLRDDLKGLLQFLGLSAGSEPQAFECGDIVRKLIMLQILRVKTGLIYWNRITGRKVTRSEKSAGYLCKHQRVLLRREFNAEVWFWVCRLFVHGLAVFMIVGRLSPVKDRKLGRPARRREVGVPTAGGQLWNAFHNCPTAHWVGDLGLGEDGVVAVSSDNVRLHGRLFASRSKIVE